MGTGPSTVREAGVASTLVAVADWAAATFADDPADGELLLTFVSAVPEAAEVVESGRVDTEPSFATLPPPRPRLARPLPRPLAPSVLMRSLIKRTM